MQQDQYLFHETNNALVLIKTSSCHGVSPMFENDFRLLEKWMVHDDNDGAGTTGVRVMVQTGVKWIKSWSPAKMGEGQMHADVEETKSQRKFSCIKFAPESQKSHPNARFAVCT